MGDLFHKIGRTTVGTVLMIKELIKIFFFPSTLDNEGAPEKSRSFNGHGSRPRR